MSPAGDLASCPACDTHGARPAFAKMGLDYHRCRGCGVLFAHPIPAGAAASYEDPAYFQALALHTTDGDLNSMKIETARRRLAELLAAGGRAPLLELGCGLGHFLGEAGALVPIGMDVSMTALRLARKRCIPRVVASSPEALPLPDASFAAVAMYDTLEHLARPREAMLEIARVLRPGGLLHLTTPNARGLSARLLGRSFPHINPEHVVLFGRRALRALLRASGFRVLGTRSVRKPLSLDYLSGRLARYRVPVLTPLLGKLAAGSPSLGRRSLLLPSGELSVVAERLGR